MQLRALPYHEQITQHFCIQGWSGVAKWGGVSMQTILDLVKPLPEAKWVVFYSLGDGPEKGIYYDAHPIEQMSYELTMLAYDMNGEPLSFGHGAPLRLRNETQLGFKMVKWIKGIEFVEHFSSTRRRLRRVQRRPRILRLPPIDMTGPPLPRGRQKAGLTGCRRADKAGAPVYRTSRRRSACMEAWSSSRRRR